MEIVSLPLIEVVNRDKIFSKLHHATVFCHKLKRKKYHRTEVQNGDISSTLFLQTSLHSKLIDAANSYVCLMVMGSTLLINTSQTLFKNSSSELKYHPEAVELPSSMSS